MRPMMRFPLSVLTGARIGAAALLCGTALFCSSALPAQSFTPATRIVDRIDESQLATLKGNTHPAANAKNDRGRVSPDLRMTDLILVLSRDPAQQAAFEKFVASQYDPDSPNFHQWLTPEQVGENFGPSPADINTVTNWLTGHGFSVDEIPANRLSIRFSGTAAQVESAFHTEMHNLEVKGVAHIGNMTDPQIPAALAPAVVGVKALHNFFPRPAHHMGSQVQRDSASGKWKRNSATLSAEAKSASVRPQFGISVSGSEPYLVEDVGPSDFATIYNVLPLWNGSTAAGVIDGRGQKIAIAGTSDIDAGQAVGTETGANGNNDVLTFRNTFGLPAVGGIISGIPANTPIRVSGNSQPLTVCTDPGTENYPPPCTIDDLVENSLDVEWSGAIAKNAQIVLVASYVPPANLTDDGLFDSESYIVDNIGNPTSPVYGARIMNVSYGECELGIGTAGNVEYYNLWQTAAAEGIAVFVAAGDSGSASCDDGDYVTEFGLTVSGLASTPFDTAVGGTDFNWCNPDTANGSANTECQASPYWNPTSANSSGNNSTTGASVSATGPQLGYIRETPWNESCANPLTLQWVQDIANYVYGYSSSDIQNTEQACNFVYDYSFNYYGRTEGLGVTDPYLESLVETVGGSGGASNCVANNTVATSSSLGTCNGTTTTGTVTAPIPAGGTGLLGPYKLVNDGWPKPAWQTGVAGIPADEVRDIPDVSFFASDGYVSSSAYLMCASATNTNNSPCAYSTYSVPFYQEVGGTSVATPAMAGVMALINQKAGAPQGNPNSALYALAATQTYSSCSAETVTTSSQCYFNDIDTGTNAMPCDAVDITANCSTTQSTFGYSDEIGILTGYSAVQGYDQATGLGSLNVANVVNSWVSTIGTGATTVTVVPTPATVSVGQSVSVLVTVSCSGSCTGSPTPTGSVTLTGGGYTSEPEPLTGGTYTFTIPAGSLSGGSDTLTASYAGDAKYASNTGSGSVTVNKLNAVVSATPSVVPPATIPSNQTLMVTGTVTCTGTCPVSPAVPTGTVTVSYGSTYTSLPAQVNSGGSYSVTITPNSLTGPSGTDTLTVLYSGDANYNPSSTTTSVSVTFFQVLNPTLTVTVTPSTATVDSGSPIQVTVEVTGAGTTPSGTVTLAGGGYSLTQQTLQTPQSGVASVSFNISANTLNSDPNFPTSDTLTADYQGDLDYAQAIKMVTLTVVQSSFSLAATPPASVSPGSTTTSTVSVSSPSDYTGAITFPATCALTGYPAGVTASTPSLPTCALTGNGKVTVTDGVPSGTVTYTVSTTGTATQALLNGNQGAPAARQHGSGWFEAAGGTALAALFLFLVPAGSRKGRQMFSVLLLMTAGSFAVIGCGGGSSTPPSLATPTVTVTPSVTGLSVNSPLTVTVNVSGSSGTPTGGVTISGGGYSSSSQLSSGSVSFNIPANAFSTIGSVTLTASYLGDSNYNSGSGSATITVNNVPTIAGNYTFT
ncbi:MAG: Ig-like domain repeat protein, partial [Terracidiphilus sp.]